MAFINELVTQEDREKYFPKYEILERYYPRDWTIDKDREVFLFLRSREREDMYSDEYKDKYGEYRRQIDIFIYQNSIIDIEIIRPLNFVRYLYIDKFIIGEVNILNNIEYNETLFKEIFTEAMCVNRGFGIYMDPSRQNRLKFEIDFSDMKLHIEKETNNTLDEYSENIDF